MSITQIALDPPSVKWANVEKKVPQTILASLYTPSAPLRAMPIRMETTHLKKGLIL